MEKKRPETASKKVPLRLTKPIKALPLWKKKNIIGCWVAKTEHLVRISRCHFHDDSVDFKLLHREVLHLAPREGTTVKLIVADHRLATWRFAGAYSTRLSPVL